MDAMKPMKPMSPMQPMKPMQSMSPMPNDAKPWWPQDLGQPSSSGSQNQKRYAYFADSHRLAVDDGGRTTVYDTGRHSIHGFAQQQGGTSSMRFQSDSGPIDVDSLTVV